MSTSWDDEPEEVAPGADVRDGMIEALSDAAFEAVIIHREGVIQSANRAAHELAGVEAGGLIGHELMEFIPPRERPGVLARIRAGDQRPYESEVLSRDGRRIPVEVRGRMVPLQLEGGPARVVALRDLREKRGLEEQIRNAQKMEVVGRLAGGIAHDFNNLLTVILAGLDLFGRGLDDDSPYQRNLSPIREAAERAAELTKQLLTLARRQVLRPRVVDVSELCAGLLPMLRRAVGEHVIVELTRAEGARVEADPMQLEMMLLNLAVNARDAMSEGGRLTIEVETTDASARLEARSLARPPAPHVCVTVTDTGHGMDAATRERVFEPFFTSKPIGDGTGLGLATVFSIVQQMGGAIWVDTEPGEGASFVMVLPRAERDVEPDEAEPEPRATRGGARILLVEDHQFVRSVIARVLDEAGHEVIAMDGPTAALEWAETAIAPDLVVSDVVMPTMNGVTMVRRLRRLWPAVPVLFISGYDPEGPASQALGLEGSELLSKPANAEEILGAVEGCLGDRTRQARGSGGTGPR